MRPDPAQCFGSDAQKRSEVLQGYFSQYIRLVFEEFFVALAGSFKLDGIHALLRQNQCARYQFAEKIADFDMRLAELVQAFFREVNDFRVFQTFDDQVAGFFFKITGDGEAKVFLRRKPFGNFLAIFEIKNSGKTLVDKINVPAGFVFPQDKITF